MNLHLWSTYCVPGAVLGFGDSAKAPALVGLYLVEEDREKIREVIKK